MTVPELDALAAARGRELTRVLGAWFVDEKSRPEELISLWLEFSPRPLLRLRGHPSGEGFSIDESAGPALDDFWDDVVIRSLAAHEHVGPLLGTALRGLRVFAWSPPLHPVGVGLELDGELVIVNLGDQLETYAGLPPYFEQYREKYGLRDYVYEGGELRPRP